LDLCTPKAAAIWIFTIVTSSPSHNKIVVAIDLDSRKKIPGSDGDGIRVVNDLGRGFISATDPGSVLIAFLFRRCHW
jgi:hypothetical protein